MILDNMGLTPSFTIRAYIDNGTVSDADGEILVSLEAGARPDRRLRRPAAGGVAASASRTASSTSSRPTSPARSSTSACPRRSTCRWSASTREENLAVAKKLRSEMAKIPGIADVHIHQITDYPTLRVDVDRVMASELGLTQQNVTGSVLVSLSSAPPR